LLRSANATPEEAIAQAIQGVGDAEWRFQFSLRDVADDRDVCRLATRELFLVSVRRSIPSHASRKIVIKILLSRLPTGQTHLMLQKIL
jgi:hypothetical protein